MEYLKEVEAFIKWVKKHKASTSEVTLWYALLPFTEEKGWNVWFTVPNPMLQHLTGMSKSRLGWARNSLVEAGLIQYQNNKASQQEFYRMNQLA